MDVDAITLFLTIAPPAHTHTQFTWMGHPDLEPHFGIFMSSKRATPTPLLSL